MDDRLEFISKVKIDENPEKSITTYKLMFRITDPIVTWTWPLEFSELIVNYIKEDTISSDRIGIVVKSSQRLDCLPFQPVAHLTPNSFDDFMDLMFAGVDTLYGSFVVMSSVARDPEVPLE